MDAQQFLAEFGHIANAPGGVAQLRALVLQLAISGRLTERVPDDLPAAELIDLNKREQRALRAKKAIKRQPDPSAVEARDHPWRLPEGWAWTRLGHVTNYGDAPKIEFDDVTQDTWVLELEDVEKGTSTLLAKVCARERKFKSTKNGFPAGAVLYGKLRPYLDKVLIADSPGVCTTEISPISFFSQIDAGYLRWYLKSPYFIAYADGSTYGMNLPRLGTDAAREALFPFPPQREQSSIVAKVNELMSLCDRLEQQQQDRRKLQNALRQSTLQALGSAESPHELQESWKRLQANFGHLSTYPADVDALRQTVLQLAVRGRLGTQEREDESAQLLLKRIATERLRLVKGGKANKTKAVPPVIEEEVPFLVPDGWAWARFADVANIASNLVQPQDHPNEPHVAPDCIEKGSGRLLGFRTVAEDKVRSSKHRFYPGQILYSKIRPNLSKVILVDFGGLCSADMYPIDAWIDRRYLHCYMLSGSFLMQVTADDNRLAMPKVNQAQLSAVLVPVPPLDEQRRIVAKVDQLMRICEKLGKQLHDAGRLANRLAIASVATLTGIAIEQEAEIAMKAPQTELIAPLRLGTLPDVKDQAPLATLLARHNGEMSARDLWQRFGGEIDAFYAQLKTEVAHRWIEDPSYNLDPNAPDGPKKFPGGALVAKMKIKQEV